MIKNLFEKWFGLQKEFKNIEDARDIIDGKTLETPNPEAEELSKTTSKYMLNRHWETKANEIDDVNKEIGGLED